MSFYVQWKPDTLLANITNLDIGLFSVGITDEIDESFLAAISGDIGVTNGNQLLGYDYFKAPDFTALDSMLETVSTGICENPKPSKFRSRSSVNRFPYLLMVFFYML